VTSNYLPGAGEDADTNVTTAFTYDLLGNRLAVTDPEGYAFKAEYDLQNRLSKKQDAEGYEWEYNYDPMGNLLSVLNPRGYTTDYVYTPTNRLQSVTNPEEHSKTLAYNANGKLTQVIDPKGIVTAFAYNELDRRSSLTKNSQPAVASDQQTNVSTKFEYDLAGNLRFVTNPLNHQAEIRYDAAHRRSEMIDFEGGSTTFAYDKVNNLLTVTDAEGNATAYRVDELNRLTAVTNAENETTRYTYDLVGNRTQLTEADDTVTLYEFDGVYRLNRVHENYRPDQDPGNDVNAVTAYSYDRRGLLTGIINANNAETLFEHNSVGKLIRETDPLSKTWEYAYDGNRNRISRQDGKGDLTEYGFFPDDMPELISYADGDTVAYQYDANNNRIAMSDRLGETSWAFDPLNRVTEQDDPFDRVLGYQYDAASNRTGITYPDDNQVGYEYSPNNWLRQMTVGAKNLSPLQTDYSRDLVGNLTQIVNPNQTETTVAYDKVYRTLERINRQVTNGGKTNSGFKYSYNEVGHITETVKEYGWRKPSVVTETYGYDGLHRLAYMSMSPIKNNGGTAETSYDYDPVGNRLSWETNDDLQTNTPFDGFSRTYEYNAANQMLAMENAADKKNDDFAYEYSFDANGNRINRQQIDRNGPQYGVDYSYDPENRLTLAQDYQIVGGTKKEEAHRIDRAFTTLEYDGGGRRLVQHYDPKQGGNGVDKRDEYVFDGLDPVAEYKMLNGQRTDYYRGAGGHLALMHQYKGGTQGQMYWYHYNNKGDVVGLTKHNGNSHHNYRYDPYGAVLPENGNFTDPHNHYTLTGKELDENTGLVWFGSRHYEPETGVWMGQDVYRGRLSDPGSLHRYGYVKDNPLNFIDIFGFKTYLVVYGNGWVGANQQGNNFLNAAKTMEQEIKGRTDYDDKADEVYLMPTYTQKQFEDALNYDYSTGNISELHVFSHSSNELLNFGGISGQNTDHVLWQYELENLSPDFDMNALVQFWGCNTGNSQMKEDKIPLRPFAQIFANKFNIRVKGSTFFTSFTEKDEDGNVYLKPDRIDLGNEYKMFTREKGMIEAYDNLAFWKQSLSKDKLNFDKLHKELLEELDSWFPDNDKIEVGTKLLWAYVYTIQAEYIAIEDTKEEINSFLSKDL
jgi:RHS repeat-associated protein